MANSRLCSIPECGKSVKAHGLCENHYYRLRTHGDPLGGGTSKGEAKRFYEETVLTYDGDECLIWPYARLPSGYAKMQGHNVHRRLCEETRGPAPTPQHEAAHSCGKGHLACVTKRHLDWKTKAQNQADRLIHGTDLRGEKVNGAKLTEADVLAIRASTETGVTIAKRYGLHPAYVSLVRSGKRWGWLLATHSGS